MPRALFQIWVVGSILLAVPMSLFAVLMGFADGKPLLFVAFIGVWAAISAAGWVFLRVIAWIFVAEPEP